jgi:hypothetical protein
MRREALIIAALPLAFAALPASAAQKAKLPCVVYSDPGASVPYVPSGYMGDTGALHVNDNCKVHPHSGKSCMQVSFTGKDWAGVVWQSPANDWGDQPGGFNLSGAKKLTFWARGAHGGEKVDFKFGLLGKNKKFHDSASGEANTTLTSGWKQYTINLAGKNLSQIKTGFVFVVSGTPTTFYLDDVRYQ